MKIKTPAFSAHIASDGGWFRLFGVGIGWKNTRRIPLIFSERNGYRRHLMVGAWSFVALRPRSI